MSRIGKEINKLRLEKGLTQKQLGKLVGVSESYIGEVESGKRVLKGELAVRITKALGMLEERFTGPEVIEEAGTAGRTRKAAPPPVQEIWSEALGSVLKSIPVYDYKMDKAVSAKQLPVVSNKVEGRPKEKIFYLRIADNEMSGFRICQGDLALACLTQQIEADAFYFVEYNGKRAVRSVKRLEGEKLLLIGNNGVLFTETASKKDVRALAHLIRLEVEL